MLDHFFIWFVAFDFELLFNKDFTACWNTMDHRLLKECYVLLACTHVCSVGLGLAFYF